MRRRVSPTSVSTGVPAIGKKRIRCSGGGSGVMSRMRWSSVSLVRSLSARRLSAAGLVDLGLMTAFRWVRRAGNKKPPGLPAVVWGALRFLYALASPAAERCENQKNAK